MPSPSGAGQPPALAGRRSARRPAAADRRQRFAPFAGFRWSGPKLSGSCASDARRQPCLAIEPHDRAAVGRRTRAASAGSRRRVTASAPSQFTTCRRHDTPAARQHQRRQRCAGLGARPGDRPRSRRCNRRGCGPARQHGCADGGSANGAHRPAHARRGSGEQRGPLGFGHDAPLVFRPPYRSFTHTAAQRGGDTRPMKPASSTTTSGT